MGTVTCNIPRIVRATIIKLYEGKLIIVLHLELQIHCTAGIVLKGVGHFLAILKNRHFAATKSIAT